MSLCHGKLFMQFLLKNHLISYRYLSLSSVKQTRYAKNFIEPVVDKEELNQPLEEFDQRRHLPVKAAKTEENTLFYNDPLIQKFINHIMRHGRKEQARLVMDKTLGEIKRQQLKKYHSAESEASKETIVLDPVKVVHMAHENCKPVLMIKPVVRGGFKYKVPVPCEGNTQNFKAFKMIIDSAKEQNKKTPMYLKLSKELLAAAENEGEAVRKKRELHRLCDSNRAYAHFRW